MGRAKYQVVYYKTRNSRCPTADFVEGLEASHQVYIMNGLERLAQHGLRIGRPHVAFLRDDIYELRVRARRNAYRFFFFFFDGRKFVITHGYLKRSRKVPDSEIDKAVEYRQDYYARKAKG